MSDRLKAGFDLGDWQVTPLEGRLTGPDGERHLRPRVMDVLLVLADNAGTVVERETLVRAVWGERAVTDEPLTRAIADLRQALGDRRGKPEYVETIPKRGYRLVAPVRTAEKSTDAGSPEHAGVSPSTPSTRLRAAGALVVIVTAIAFGWWLNKPQHEAGTGPGAARPSIVVLPLETMSAVDDDERFADGLTETLTHVLAQVDGLRVVARTSAFAYKDNPRDVREIGRTLGVQAVLEGSVQRDANTLRITTQLVNTHDGSHYWSRNFDRDPEALFAIQDEIAAAVAAALKVALFGGRTGRASRAAYATRSVPAYDAYLAGRRNLARRTSASIAQAIEDFKQALSHDADYTLAWVGLADAWLLSRYYGNVSHERMLAEATGAIDKALALDPDLGQAYASIGLLHWQLAKTREAEQALQRAIALEPNYAQAYFWLGTVYNDAGRPAQALEMHRAALDLDPLSPAIHNAVAVSLEKLGQFDEALVQYHKVVELDPGYAATVSRNAQLHWSALARLDEAVRLQHEALAIDPGFPESAALLAELYLDLSDADTAGAWVDRTEQLGPESTWSRRARGMWLAHARADADARLRIGTDSAGLAQSGESTALLLRIARDVMVDRSRPGDAVALYRATLPGLFDPEPTVSERNLQAAVDLALVAKLAGDDPLAERLLAAAEVLVDDLPRLGCCGFGLADAEIGALRGDRQSALDRLDEAVAAGWRKHWWFYTTHNPAMADLQSHPRFVAAVETLGHAADAARERVSLARSTGAASTANTAPP